MRLYHTCASQPDLERARNLAPSIEHGVGTLPTRLSHGDAPWFLDNGAYSGQFDPEEFRAALERAAAFDRPPEFVVVPDSPGDPEATRERVAGWTGEILDHGLTPYGVIQPGRLAEQFVRLPDAVEGVLVGGAGGANADRDWRRSPTGVGRPRIDFVTDLARERGLAVHVGRPGANLSWWVHETDVDSLDTASVVRNGYWHRLRRVEAANDPNQMVIA